jgi:hypothetical protein
VTGHGPCPKTACAARASRRRGARLARGHRAHGPRGGMAGGGPPVDGRRRGHRVEHQQRGAEAPSKVIEVGTYPNGVTSTRGMELERAAVFRRWWGPPVAVVVGGAVL